MNEKLTDKFEGCKDVYKLLSRETIKCKYITEEGKTKSGECWLVMFLDGQMWAIVKGSGRGLGGAVSIEGEGVSGYFFPIQNMIISETALKKYLRSGGFHMKTFSVFQ